QAVQHIDVGAQAHGVFGHEVEAGAGQVGQRGDKRLDVGSLLGQDVGHSGEVVDRVGQLRLAGEQCRGEVVEAFGDRDDVGVVGLDVVDQRRQLVQGGAQILALSVERVGAVVDESAEPVGV